MRSRFIDSEDFKDFKWFKGIEGFRNLRTISSKKYLGLRIKSLNFDQIVSIKCFN